MKTIVEAMGMDQISKEIVDKDGEENHGLDFLVYKHLEDLAE